MQDDIQNDNLVNDKVVNDKALDLLDEAMFTSSHNTDPQTQQARVDTYHYANGRTETHTETNAGNILVVDLKIGLIIVGAFIFAFIASVIMTIETALGLMHNFDWSGTKQVTSGSKAER